MSAKNAVFDGFDFLANGLTVSRIDMQSRTPRDLQLEDRASAPGAILVSTHLKPKPVTLAGRMRATTGDDLDTLMDNVKLALNGTERVLDIDHAGGTRRYIATADNIIIGQDTGEVTVASFDAQFIVPSGYGTDVEPTELFSTTITQSGQSAPFTVGGSFDAEPVITMTINSLTAGAGTQNITLYNTATTEQVTINSASFVAGTSIAVYTQTKQTYVDNSLILSGGSYPVWGVGVGNLLVTDTFSARNISINGWYTRRWL